MTTLSSPGTIALIYYARSETNQRAVRPLHKQLLEHIQETPRVVVLPTALVPNASISLEDRAEMSIEHFGLLGAQVKPVMLLTRQDAQKPEIVEQIKWSNVVWFSGGSDKYLAETLQGTPAWEAVLQVYRHGGMVATGSAMTMGDAIFQFTHPQGRLRVELITYLKLDLLSGLTILPGLRGWLKFSENWRALLVDVLSQIPQTTLVGMDDLTALVGREGKWSVYGKGKVTVFDGKKEVSYSRGKEVKLPLPPPS